MEDLFKIEDSLISELHLPIVGMPHSLYPMQLSLSNSNQFCSRVFSKILKNIHPTNCFLLIMSISTFAFYGGTSLSSAFANDEEQKAGDFSVVSWQKDYDLYIELTAPDGFHFNQKAPHSVLVGLEGEESYPMLEVSSKSKGKGKSTKHSKGGDSAALNLLFKHDMRKKMATTHFLAQAFLCDAANTICEQHSVEGSLFELKKKGQGQESTLKKSSQTILKQSPPATKIKHP